MFNVVLLEPEKPDNTGNIGRTCVATGSALHLIYPIGFQLTRKNIHHAGLDYWDRLKLFKHDNYGDFLNFINMGKDAAHIVRGDAVGADTIRPDVGAKDNAAHIVRGDIVGADIIRPDVGAKDNAAHIAPQECFVALRSLHSLRKRSGVLGDIVGADTIRPAVGAKHCEPTIWFATTKAHKSYTDVKFNDGDYIMFGKESAGIPEEILAKDEEHCIRIPMIENERSLNLSNSVAIVLYEALRQNNFNGMMKKGELHRLSYKH